MTKQFFTAIQINQRLSKRPEHNTALSLFRSHNQIFRAIIVTNNRLLLQYTQVLHVLQEALVRRQEFRALDVLLQLLHVPLELRPPVLEPRDHLRVREAQTRGDLVAIRGAEVLLVEEALFQLEDLVVREGCSRFSLLLGLLAVVEEVQVVLAVWKGEEN